jgi:hypothetical protein
MQSSGNSVGSLLNRPTSGREYALRVLAAIGIVVGLLWWLHDHPATSRMKLTRQCLVAYGFDVKKTGPRTLQVGDSLVLTFYPTVAAAKRTGIIERKRNVLFKGDHSDIDIGRCLDRAAQ